MKLGTYSPLASIALCLWIGACDKETPVGTTHTTSGEVPAQNQNAVENPSGAPAPAADNTRVNLQDNPAGPTAGMNPTPMNQGNGAADLAVTQQIRQALMADHSLSNDAQNVKIITANGTVTLRGPVRTEVEHSKITAKASQLAGGNTLDDQIEIERAQ